MSKTAGISEESAALLKADELATTAAAEAAANAGGATGAAEGGADAGASGATAAASAEGATAAAGATGAAEGATGAADEQPERVAAFVPTLENSDVPANAQERIGQIKVERAAALKKMYNGEMTAEEFAELDDKLVDERASLSAAIERSKFNAQFNQQMTSKMITHTTDTFLKAVAKGGGVDYKDAANRAKFDRALAVLSADPEHSGKPIAELESVLEAADQMVKAQIGWKAPAPKTDAAAAGATAAAGPRAVPTTLATLPAAAPAATEDEGFSKAVALDGPALARHLASQPKGEVERLLRKAS